MFLKLFPRYAGRARRGATVAGDHLRGTAVVVENACAFYLFIRDLTPRLIPRCNLVSGA